MPQGSILGPTLFLIYVNDIYQQLDQGEVLLFADDTTFIFQGKKEQDLIWKTNLKLKKMFHWYAANKLTVHPEKTMFMTFLTKN